MSKRRRTRDKKQKQRAARLHGEQRLANMPSGLLEDLLSANFDRDEVGQPDEADEWREIDELVNADDIEILTCVVQANPRNLAAQIALLEACEAKGRFWEAVEPLEAIVRLAPHQPEWRLALVDAYRNEGRICAALVELRTVRRRWPKHPLVAATDDTLAELELKSRDRIEDLGLSGGATAADVALHEHAEASSLRRNPRKAIHYFEQLVARLPTFICAWNNLANFYFAVDERHKAQEALKRSIELDPQNIFAMSVKIRFHFLAGQFEEARRWAEALWNRVPAKPTEWVKKAEAYAWLGDDERVLNVLRDFESSVKSPDRLSEAMLHHLRAVALYRTGQEKEALKDWELSDDAYSHLRLAADNLNAWKANKLEFSPWYFDLSYWVRPGALETIQQILPTETQDAEFRTIARLLPSLLKKYPELIALVPAMCDRGDFDARTFALMLALHTRSPQAMQSLTTFVQGRWGSSAERAGTANFLVAEGILRPGPFRFYSQGRWMEVLEMGWDITDEPVYAPLPCEELQEMLNGAYEALGAKRWVEAERMLREAWDRGPQVPDTLNNLVVAVLSQGRRREAMEMLRELTERWPDYFFGRLAMANLAMEEGDLNLSDDLHAGLIARRQYHITEFRGLVRSLIRCAIRRHDSRWANLWLEYWSRMEPDSPELATFRVLIATSAISSLPRRTWNWCRQTLGTLTRSRQVADT